MYQRTGDLYVYTLIQKIRVGLYDLPKQLITLRRRRSFEARLPTAAELSSFFGICAGCGFQAARYHRNSKEIQESFPLPQIAKRLSETREETQKNVAQI
jgi:hypothetical protein